VRNGLHAEANIYVTTSDVAEQITPESESSISPV
jgi:hypothetical protein